MDRKAVLALALKDLRVSLRSPGVLLPLIILPVILLVLMPIGAVLVVTFVPIDAGDLDDFKRFLDALPASTRTQLEGLNEKQLILTLLLRHLFAPLFLLVPIMVASVLAADSFAGEKERGTLEALLYTPLTDRELLLAKALGAWIPATIISVVGTVAYAVIVDIAAWPVMQRLLLPDLGWLLLGLWVGPAGAGLGLGFTVLVSSRANSLQEAFQLSGMVVLPVVAILLGQVAGVLYLSDAIVFGLGLLLWGVVIALLRTGARLFSRDSLLTRR